VHAEDADQHQRAADADGHADHLLDAEGHRLLDRHLHGEDRAERGQCRQRAVQQDDRQLPGHGGGQRGLRDPEQRVAFERQPAAQAEPAQPPPPLPHPDPLPLIRPDA
jgi:hypothetical protein